MVDRQRTDPRRKKITGLLRHPLAFGKERKRKRSIFPIGRKREFETYNKGKKVTSKQSCVLHNLPALLLLPQNFLNLQERGREGEREEERKSRI